MILYRAEKLQVIMDPNPRILSSIILHDFQCVVRAAVVDDDIFPCLISLREHTFNTISKVLLAVIDRSDDTYKRLPEQISNPFNLDLCRVTAAATWDLCRVVKNCSVSKGLTFQSTRCQRWKFLFTPLCYSRLDYPMSP